jgi:hypothetical protein
VPVNAMPFLPIGAPTASNSALSEDNYNDVPTLVAQIARLMGDVQGVERASEQISPTMGVCLVDPS